MSSKVLILSASLLVLLTHAMKESSAIGLTEQAAMNAMERVFARSEKVHSQSMAAIMQSMTSQKAWQVLEKRNLTSEALLQLTRHSEGKQSHRLRAIPGAVPPPKGYSGVDGARKLLNDMLLESMQKYDAEIQKCTEFYSAQCAQMEEERGQIAASNFAAANSRELILDAQATINKCEVSIPTLQSQRKAKMAECGSEISKLKARLAIVEGDITVLTTILEMTQCNSFAQLGKVSLLHCEDSCTEESFITFDHDVLKRKLSMLQSSVAQGLVKDTFKDLVSGIASLKSIQTPKVTKFNNPPVPRTDMPADPCRDGKLFPIAKNKRSNKCSIADNPKCEQLQERFILIQAGVKDEQEDLKALIPWTQRKCDDFEASILKEIQNDKDMQSDAETNLAAAQKKEAAAGEQAQLADDQHSTLDKDLRAQMKTCSQNYLNYESEQCALKKIRLELYKIKGTSGLSFFQDCVVGKWEEGECSKPCGAGDQTLSRYVLTHPNRGAACLPLTAARKCNEQPCPVDCVMDAWQGWSKCSAKCNGGVQQRMREVTTPMRHGGKPCDSESQTRSCNNQACDTKCKLSRWTHWSKCSKDCDGGTMKREKWVLPGGEAQGTGTCPDSWSKERLQYKDCNQFACLAPGSGRCAAHDVSSSSSDYFTCATLPTCCDGWQGLGKTADTVQCLPDAWQDHEEYKTKCDPKPMQCKKELDIVFLLDGSGSLGSKGWAAEIKAANLFVDAFSGTGAKANMGVILYSGPKYWSGVKKCMGNSKQSVDLESDCNIKSVTHLTSDMAAVKKAINALTWPKGSTLTSIALESAKSELSGGRKDARSVVVVITDGRPLSFKKTRDASKDVRHSARLVWVPVTKYAPLSAIKIMATRRWEENVVLVKDFKDLEKTDPINKIVANICPMDANSES